MRVSFGVVDRAETWVAGAVLRSPALAVEGSRRRRVEEVWQQMLATRMPGKPGTAYLDHAPELNSYLTHIVGYQCTDLAQLRPGDVLARIPAGQFARFVRSGDHLPDTITDLWRSVWDAEAQGELVRAYTGDFEHYLDAQTVEVFVAITEAKGAE